MSAEELIVEGQKQLAQHDRVEPIERAIEAFRLATVKDTASAQAHAWLAEAYVRRYAEAPDPQLLKQAEDNAERSVQLNEHRAAAHFVRGAVQSYNRKREEAEASYRRAIEVDPLNPVAHSRLGGLLTQNGQVEEAEASFRKGIALAKQNWVPHAEFGTFLYRRGRFAEALSAFTQPRDISPDNVIVQRNLEPIFQAGPVR